MFTTLDSTTEHHVFMCSGSKTVWSFRVIIVFSLR